MKAITTKYVGPTNYRGSRIIATNGDNRISRSYDCALNSDDNHTQGALELARKLKWSGYLAMGHTKQGCVFVWTDRAALLRVEHSK